MRVPPELGDRVAREHVPLDEPRAPEPPPLVERELGAVGERDEDLAVRGGEGGGVGAFELGTVLVPPEHAAAVAADEELAVHPEVDQQMHAALERKPALLALAARAQHAAVQELGLEFGRGRALEDLGVIAGVDPRDDLALEEVVQVLLFWCCFGVCCGWLRAAELTLREPHTPWRVRNATLPSSPPPAPAPPPPHVPIPPHLARVLDLWQLRHLVVAVAEEEQEEE